MLTDKEARANFAQNVPKPDPAYDTALDLMEQYSFATMRDTREIYVYDTEQGIWRTEGGIIAEYAQASLGSVASNHVVNEIEGHIERSTLIDRELFCGVIRNNMLHTQDGWVNMDTGKREPHSKDRLSTAKLEVPYNPKAGPIEFIRVVNAALEPEHRRTLIKVLGNILIPDCRYEKATMLVGNGHNRKSTILIAIRSVIGQANCSAVSLQELAEDRFASVELEDKLLNMVYDLKADKIMNTGRFKEAVSGDPIRVQKKCKPAYVIRPIAKHINSANDIPQANDDSDAYMRRWAIIPFYRAFERDTTIQERLSTESEKSGILNLMLYGRKLLLSEGFDDIPLEKIRAMYNKNASLVKEFLSEACILDITNEHTENKTPAYEIQQAYWKYQAKEKRRELTPAEKDYYNRQLGEELKKLGVIHKQVREKGSNAKPWCYMGIVLKEQARNGSEAISAF